MREFVVIGPFVESIQVELANKGKEVGMFEETAAPTRSKVILIPGFCMTNYCRFLPIYSFN